MTQMINLAAEPRVVDAGSGFTWWSEAWQLFMKQPGPWVVFGLVLMAVFVVLMFVPLLGHLAASLLAPVLIGGWMLAARRAAAGTAPEVADLFACFKVHLNPLLVLGALLLVGTLIIGAVAGTLGIGALLGVVMGGAHGNIAGVLAGVGAGAFAMLLAMLIGLLATMALWFAPGLVVFRGIAPVEALKASFVASLKNAMPFLLYGVVYLFASIIASIPFGLGWIVLVPLLLLTVYVSYEDVFGL
jgi:hypothetical protein